MLVNSSTLKILLCLMFYRLHVRITWEFYSKVLMREISETSITSYFPETPEARPCIDVDRGWRLQDEFLKCTERFLTAKIRSNAGQQFIFRLDTPPKRLERFLGRGSEKFLTGRINQVTRDTSSCVSLEDIEDVTRGEGTFCLSVITGQNEQG